MNVAVVVVFPGPSSKRSEMACTYGYIVVAARGFPGPDP